MLLFTQEKALITGLMLLGAPTLPYQAQLNSAFIQCAPPASGTCTLDLLIGGVRQGVNVQITNATALPLTVALNVTVPANTLMQWVVVGFDGGVGNEIAKISLAMQEIMAIPAPGTTVLSVLNTGDMLKIQTAGGGDAVAGLPVLLTWIIENSSYTFQQGTASATWNVRHNLNGYPGVTVVDSGGNVGLPDVQYLDKNNVQLRFLFAMGGTAYFGGVVGG